MSIELGISTREFEHVYALSCLEVFADVTPSLSPIGVVLGGQPASGKSLLITRVLDERPNLSFAVINGDDLRHFHPKLQEYNSLNDKDSAQHTQAFANALGQRLLREAINRRYNIIIEGTMRDFRVPSTTCELFRGAGYTSEAHVLAVNYWLSLQGIYTRYENQKASGRPGRFSPLEVHKQAYRGVLKSVDHLYLNCHVNRIGLYNRGAKEMLLDYTYTNGRWSSDALPSQTIELERKRIWSTKELVEYTLEWEYVCAGRQERGAEYDPIPYRLLERSIKRIKDTPFAYPMYLKRSSE